MMDSISVDMFRQENIMTEDYAIVVFAWKRYDLLSELLNKVMDFGVYPTYIFIDGAREDAKCCTSREETIEVAKLFSAKYDHGCTLIIREKNLGCFQNITSGLDEVCKKHEAMIILEEDCIPNESFFSFCISGLKRYKYNRSIFQISGTRFINRATESGATMSRFTHTWGWATWSTRWCLYQRTLDLLETPGFLKTLEIHNISANTLKSLKSLLRPLIGGKFKHTWDYQWLLTGLLSDQYTVLPPINTIENKGIGPTSLHTKKLPIYLKPSVGNFSISKLCEEDWSFSYDRQYTKQIFDIDILSRLKRRIASYG